MPLSPSGAGAGRLRNALRSGARGGAGGARAGERPPSLSQQVVLIFAAAALLVLFSVPLMLYRIGGLNMDANAPLRIRGGGGGGAPDEFGRHSGQIYHSDLSLVQGGDDEKLGSQYSVGSQEADIREPSDTEGTSSGTHFEPALAASGIAVGSGRQGLGTGTAYSSGQALSGHRLLGVGRAAVVIIAHNRQDCLQLCLKSLLEQQDVSFFQVAVSLDDPPTFDKMGATVKEVAGGHNVMVWHKPPSDPTIPTVTKISEHFRFAQAETFDRQGFEYGIFIENDLTLAPDALWYFRSTAWLLEDDPTLFCVSAWNDNGFRDLVSDERRLFRTDYFPGLGWMVRNDTWDSVRDIWPRFPSTGWDHWLRHGSGLRPRECVIPEVARTHHFDEHGTNVHEGSETAKQLARMATSQLQPGELGDLSYLLNDRYQEMFSARVRAGTLLDNMKLTKAGPAKDGDKLYVVPYIRDDYKRLSKILRIVDSQPRTTHHGVILTRHPVSGADIAIVDRRFLHEGLLPEAELRPPSEGYRVSGAKPGQSCDAHCRDDLGMRCRAADLEFVNRCDVLTQVFPCEDGCGHQVGLEIPCYVHDRNKDTALQCLVTDDAIPTCDAKHPSTSRLCACVT